jgi:hypothetical protein
MYSFYKEWEGTSITVLYKTTNEEYEQGYEKVKSLHPKINFHRETVLKSDLNLLISDPSFKYITFFCDDDIWKAPLTINSEEFNAFDNNPNIISLSLRMHPLISKCHPMGGLETPAPLVEGALFIWDWVAPGLRGDWSYPMSVDGGIFRRSLIEFYLRSINFNNVTEFEGYMAANPQTGIPKMICFKESPIFNIPLNIASEISRNINMNISKEYLNTRFLAGDKINFSAYTGFKNTAPHQEVELSWK